MFRWSLRAMLLAGMGGILLGGAAVSVLTSERVLRAADDRRAAVVRHDMIAASARARLLGLVDQEVGLRGYLATGDRRLLEPYETGRNAARDARLQLARLLLDGERERVSKLLDDVDDATADWITAYASPQIWAREKGPIQDLPAAFIEGKRLFERVRAAHAELSDVLRDISEAAIARADRLIQEARLIGHGVTALVFVLGLWIMRAFLRRTAGPLAELERKASAGEPFAAPGAGVKVREVAGLQQALHDLDRTARERERARAQAHARAVAFNAFGEFVQQLVDEHELHQALARTLDDTMAPDKLQILVRNASRNRLEVTWPGPLPPDEVGHHPILSEPMRCRAVRTLRPVSADSDAPVACACPLGVPEAGSYCCVPMVSAGELVGIVNMQSTERGRFPRESLEGSQGYINFASTTLSSIRLLSSTRERALRDSLTSAYNRAFLSEYLAKQLSVAARRKRPLAVLVCDLDHFKQVNDSHGHQVGDRALVAFAALLHNTVRNGDAVIRYGGEEFVVLLVDTDLAGAQVVAERIRAGAEHIIVDNGAETVGAIVRTSIGVAAYPAHGADEPALIGAADRAVYRAKREGRNRVVVAPERAGDDGTGPVLRVVE